MHMGPFERPLISRDANVPESTLGHLEQRNTDVPQWDETDHPDGQMHNPIDSATLCLLRTPSP